MAMHRLNQMMLADEENVANCRKLLRDFHPNSELLLDRIVDHYTMLSEQIEKIVHAEELGTIQQLAKEADVAIGEFTKRVEDPSNKDPLVERARAAKLTYLAREIRILMFLACKRQLLWGAAELLKFKVTPAVGYLRQQVESVGFLHLFLERPCLAVEWSAIITPEDGVKFYRATQGDLKKVMERFDLLQAYDFGSATALHVRLASLVRGAPIVDKTAARSPRFRVPYQEIDTENPFRFLLTVLNYVRNQERILTALGQAFPEASLRKYYAQINDLRLLEDKLWQRLQEAFPDDLQRVRMGAAAAATGM